MADQVAGCGYDHFQQAEKGMDDLTQENIFSERQEMVLSPEGVLPT